MNDKDLIQYLENEFQNKANVCLSSVSDKKLLSLADTAFKIANDDVNNGTNLSGDYDANEVLIKNCDVSIYSYDSNIIETLAQGGECEFELKVTVDVSTKGDFLVYKEEFDEFFDIEVEKTYNETQDDEIDDRGFNKGDIKRYNKDYNLNITYEDIYNNSFLDIYWGGDDFGNSKNDKFGGEAISEYDFNLEYVQQDFLNALQAKCPFEIDITNDDYWSEIDCNLFFDYDLAKKVVMDKDWYKADKPNMKIGFGITFSLNVVISNLDYYED